MSWTYRQSVGNPIPTLPSLLTNRWSEVLKLICDHITDTSMDINYIESFDLTQF